jgi:transcriptional regulator with XRE-family HTH domain
MFSTRLQSLLKAHRKSVTQLANFCDVSPQASYKWVKGKAEPRPAMKETIASFFGIEVGQLESDALLSVNPIKSKKNTSMTVTKTAIDLLIATELSTLGVKSDEFKQGMHAGFLFSLNDVAITLPFKPGTAQADAFEAGIAHTNKMMERLTKAH